MITDNELVAEFMGWQRDEVNGIKIWYQIGVTSPGELRFDSSWDWLMPVVEKIELSGYHVLIEDNFCRIGQELQIKATTLTKIQSVYKGVLEFIKWYNQQSQDGTM